MNRVIVYLLGVFAAVSAFAEFRIWETSDGQVMEREFITMSAGDILLRDQQGKEYRMKPEQLCEADQKYLDKVLPPKLVLDVSKVTDNSAGSSQIEYVVCEATLKQTDTRPYSGELTAVLLVIGEDIRTGGTTIAGRSEEIFSLPETRGDTVSFSSKKNKFFRKSRKSGQAYSGYVFAVWDRFGQMIAMKTSVASFEDKADKLAKPRKTQSIKSK